MRATAKPGKDLSNDGGEIFSGGHVGTVTKVEDSKVWIDWDQ